MNTEKNALIKKNDELIDAVATRLGVLIDIGKSKVDKACIDKTKTIIAIVKENDVVIALPELHIDLIRLVLRYGVLELPTNHEHPCFLSEQKRTLLNELISELSKH